MSTTKSGKCVMCRETVVLSVAYVIHNHLRVKAATCFELVDIFVRQICVGLSKSVKGGKLL